MIVRGESTIIDYHAPFDQGFSPWEHSIQPKNPELSQQRRKLPGKISEIPKGEPNGTEISSESFRKFRKENQMGTGKFLEKFSEIPKRKPNYRLEILVHFGITSQGCPLFRKFRTVTFNLRPEIFGKCNQNISSSGERSWPELLEKACRFVAERRIPVVLEVSTLSTFTLLKHHAGWGGGGIPQNTS